MKKQVLTLGFAIAALAGAPGAFAQDKPADGIIGMFGGSRVLVNAPLTLPSPSVTTFAGIGNGAWGGNLSTPINNIEVIRAIGTGSSNTDSLLCTPAANGTGGIPALTGKVAILYRGTCNFSEKAYAAQLGGAVAAIIINNAPGALITMSSGLSGASVNIPVFMVSDIDGAAIMNTLRSNTPVFMSFSRWSFGNANDVGIMPKSSASAHVGAIPMSQLAATNGNPTAYRMFNGAMAVNFGSVIQKNIENTTTIQWTPTGGAATEVYKDTAVLASLAPIDSLDLIYNQNFHNPHASTKGMYTITSRIVPSGADAITSDNSEKRTVYVTDSIYCKGAWDNVNMKPSISSARRASTTTPWSWGPLIYTAVGGDFPAKLQFTLTTGDTAVRTLDNVSVVICAFKWTDGSGGGTTDGIIQTGELKLVAQGSKAFTTADSNFSNLVVPFNPSIGGVAVAPLESSSWYYYTITPSVVTTWLGIDNGSNDYMRMYVSNKISPATREYLSPQYMDEALQIPSGGTGDVRMIPYYFAADVSIDSASIDLSGYSVNAALHTRKGIPNSVANQTSFNEDFTVSPNPSTGKVTLNYAFRKDMGTAMVTVINGMGQSVMTKMVTGATGTVSFDLTSAAAGTYWIIYGNSNGTESKQFQIVK